MNTVSGVFVERVKPILDSWDARAICVLLPSSPKSFKVPVSAFNFSQVMLLPNFPSALGKDNLY